jgi:hypothetical protein
MAVFLFTSPQEILHAKDDVRNVTAQAFVDLAFLGPLTQFPWSVSRTCILTYVLTGIPLETWFYLLKALLE